MQVRELLDVIYTAGVVFDGLSTSKPATDRFLRSGDTHGVRGRGDLALLEDLRSAAQTVIDHGGAPVTGRLVTSINASLTRSAALNPGRLRTAEQGIGVRTVYGRHEPPAMTSDQLDELVEVALTHPDPRRGAIALFIDIARAQPFEDGNKRTAIFAANAHLIAEGAGCFLTVPQSDGDPSVAAAFNEALAKAYIYGEREPLERMLFDDGIIDRV
ncbi:Fic family protein [Corynebacterium sp. TA-R-1]|uniref:Fic family protein n=1 Tax=Corynebacterium stercoris TaxID=2943490 RepID=A0ABT1G088_9CORY|nr:Fic family protein [Corynebacterium stercoris]MCP1387449.1 Fic family protein [Corynebacterium stercoris]